MSPVNELYVNIIENLNDIVSVIKSSKIINFVLKIYSH